ncbi:nucleoside-diphosphate sugar epimerase/dehydratase [Erysipelothrix urinaevulpis]|uniref:polysaccharide biosynthesis protein n=1 Tax=Erysipelothrix urinaevulpis TaxID=2683717 RepID=UPI00135B3C97|nr:nucleoside-diphosphate sugar epimerase/dehydratase [Erysipelothrix urinaevulpis]
MRSFILLIVDVLIVIVSYFFATAIRFDLQESFIEYFQTIKSFLPYIALIHGILYKVFKTDKTVWSRISVDEALSVIVANFISMIIIIVFRLARLFPGISIGIILISFGIMTLLQEIMRFSYRVYRRKSLRNKRILNKNERIIIYGAGSAGHLIAREFIENPNLTEYIVGFIDDNPEMKGKTILGLTVFGNRKILPKVIQEQSATEVIVAMPSADYKKRKQIMQHTLNLGIKVRTVGSVQNLMKDNGVENSLRSLEISDLLERPEIQVDCSEINTIITDKTILVTGAGGSIGSELVRQIASYGPKALVLVDISETALYDIQQELEMKFRSGDLDRFDCVARIASIREEDTLERIFSKYSFDMVFHAAAHKHVPLMEYAPKEAIKNNILGTRNLLKLSDKYNVKQFVNVSTDKAVNPTNVMGATKRFNEMMLQSINQTSQTNFVAVRFGNVLGSNGSVVPLFQKQIKQGGPVTVTHPDIIRYFMTIPEAVSLILQAATYADGGEIFVLDMGEPVKILQLAENVIKLSGYEPYVDIEIEFTGLRPGEKLFEELLMAEEGLQKTENDLIYIANPIYFSEEEIKKSIKTLEKSLTVGPDAAIQALKNVVPTFVDANVVNQPKTEKEEQ